jgi:hypothetical protein
MLTVIGPVVTSEGLVHSADPITGEVDSVAYVPAAAYVADQPAELPVHFEHATDWRLGTVGYLERSDRLGLMCVATLEVDVRDILDDGPWFWSDSITCKRHGQQLERSAAKLSELSLVRRTGNCGTRPVVVVPGDIALGAARPRAMPLLWDDVWDRAAAHLETARYRRADHLTIHNVDPPDEADAPAGGPTVLWYGTELGGEVAQRVVDALRFGSVG